MLTRSEPSVSAWPTSLEDPKLPRSPELADLAAITDLILGKYAAMLKTPKCYMYYVTTGQWTGDAVLAARRASVIDDLTQLAIFEHPEMTCAGAAELHRAYRATKSSYHFALSCLIGVWKSQRPRALFSRYWLSSVL